MTPERTERRRVCVCVCFLSNDTHPSFILTPQEQEVMQRPAEAGEFSLERLSAKSDKIVPDGV